MLPEYEPTLIAIEGPLKGTVLVLHEWEVSLGRDESNALAVDDPAASRRHCVICRERDKFRLKDLNSRNGTLVNGRPVRQRVLDHGDQIKIGTSVFLFSRRTASAGKSAVVLEEQLETTSTSRLCGQDSSYLRPGPLESASFPAETARDLKALLRISAAMQEAQTVAGLAHRLLELLLEAVPAGRAALLLTGSSGSLGETFGLYRGGGSTKPLGISPSVTGRVLKERVAFVIDNLTSGDAHCLIAAPLVCGEDVQGVLYADTQDPKLRFEEPHLELVTAAGAIAGMALERVLRMNALDAENRRLECEISIRHEMIGESRPMIEIYRQIDRAAPTDATVLIQGESGTGKELVARAIHRNSRRAARPFVAINCAALSESLLESELFGHERGAFTGAMNLRKGRFEVADGGTLFLDEIAEMALVPQAKLLRVLQERQFERVGGSRPIHVDTRLVVATNKDLKSEAGRGAFRQDLYYRLKVITIRMPALRERRDDIPLLARYFLHEYAERAGRAVSGFSKEAQDWLVRYEWPGNVREMQHAIEQAVILGASDTVRLEDLREAVREQEDAAPFQPTRYHEALEQARREVIRQALEQAGGVYTQAAKLLGLHPVHLHRLIRSLNLKPELQRKQSTSPGGH